MPTGEHVLLRYLKTQIITEITKGTRSLLPPWTLPRLLIGLSFTVCPHKIKMALVNHPQQKTGWRGGGGFDLSGTIFLPSDFCVYRGTNGTILMLNSFLKKEAGVGPF